MSLIVSWFLFPLFLGAITAGWGCLAERTAGVRVGDALLLPLGLAAVLVVAGTLGAFTATAAAAAPVVAVGALVGLPRAWAERERLGGWPLIATAGAIFAFGAPVLLSGEAGFAGYIRLDDTAAWLNVVDHLPTGPHAAPGELPSTYSLEYNEAIGPHYPRGSFVLLAVAHSLIAANVAWLFQPYLAVCGAGVALSVFALAEPVVASARARALVAFLAAQASLLYGYSLWGGIKELTAAFLLALTVAFVAAAFKRRPARARESIPLALAAGALIQTLGVGAGGWIGIAFGLLAASWLWLGWRAKKLAASVGSVVSLGALTAACMVPVWISLGDFLANDAGLFSSGQDEHTRLGNLIEPLNVFQLAGIWPVGDFRLTPPQLATVLLVGLVFLGAIAALAMCVRRREWGPLLYPVVALLGCGLVYYAGATPWVVGKTMAIASPALLAVALVGAAMMLKLHRAAALALAALAFGVLWSTALGYHNAVLAPRASQTDLQQIGTLVGGKQQTLLNRYEIYGTYHFLREGAPTGPADYRPVNLALSDGTVLSGDSWADLDSLPLPALQNYRSIVTQRSPAESRPPSNYRLVWPGEHYQLWQRSESPARTVLAHTPLGESVEHPYCGEAQFGEAVPACSVDPVAIPPCSQIRAIGRQAAEMKGNLIAHQRAEPIIARADETRWPGEWFYDPDAHTLTPNSPGDLVASIRVASSQDYELWLAGSFARGFEVSIDGERIGGVENELATIGGYAHVGDVFLTTGTHEFILTYPHPDLSPGSGDNTFTTLEAISLQPRSPRGELIETTPDRAARLCGRPLDWIEIVTRG